MLRLRDLCVKAPELAIFFSYSSIFINAALNSHWFLPCVYIYSVLQSENDQYVLGARALPLYLNRVTQSNKECR